MMKFRLVDTKKKKIEDEKLSEELEKAKKVREAIRLRKLKKKQERRQERKKHNLEYYLTKAGIVLEPRKVVKRVFNVSVVINLLLSAYIVYYFSTHEGFTMTYIIIMMIILWVILFAGLIFVVWLLLFILLDLKMLKRKLDLEEVLPDFLQLTASNVKSGMPIDQSLWYAVRPRFGILANEIEIVAKETMSGVDLDEALKKFSAKYDSPTLKRTISLMIEGIRAGGEIADLIMKIATDIQDTKIMKKEMAASVTTYVIFIGFATILASPFLFGLAGQLIVIIKSLTAGMDLGAAASGGSIGISLKGGGISIRDFRIFSIVMLTITSTMSAAIISTIQKGNVKEGIKYIPMFVIITLILYFVVSFGIEKLFSGMF